MRKQEKRRENEGWSRCKRKRGGRRRRLGGSSSSLKARGELRGQGRVRGSLDSLVKGKGRGWGWDVGMGTGMRVGWRWMESRVRVPLRGQWR